MSGDIAEVKGLLGEVIGKLDMLHEDVRDTAKRADRIEDRLRFVENMQKWAAGVVAGAAAFIGYVIKTKTTEGL